MGNDQEYRASRVLYSILHVDGVVPRAQQSTRDMNYSIFCSICSGSLDDVYVLLPQALRVCDFEMPVVLGIGLASRAVAWIK